MGFFSRKPIRLGGIRFDFLKSDRRVSITNSKFWLGLRTDGNFIHIGQSGVSYKTVNHAHKSHGHPFDPQSRFKQPNTSRQVEYSTTNTKPSSCLSLLRDSASQKLLDELNRKRINPLFCPFALAFIPVTKFGVAISAVLVVLVYFLIDRPRKSTLLYYDIDPNIENEIKLFYRSFSELSRCDSAWFVTANLQVSNRKYNAGAPTNVKRKRIKITYKAPPMIITNVTVPSIPIGKQRLYFFPDRVFITGNSSIRAIGYSNLKITQSNQPFIEDMVVPANSKQVGETYQYVNLDGSPDHRFRYNRNLPVLLYSELHIEGSSIQNALILLSTPNAGKCLSDALKRYSSMNFLLLDSTSSS